jgi:hypothetical protein
MNEAGAIIGYVRKYLAGNYVGVRAVRWAADSTTAVELAVLGTDAEGVSLTAAAGVNIAGAAVGTASVYPDGKTLNFRAVAWLPDASVIDLNELGIRPASDGGAWLLEQATGLTADGWITGTGKYDPPTGPSYERAWVAQLGLGGTWTDAFTGNLNGTWGRGPQWSTGTPAMQVGDASFISPGSYTVTLDRDETTRSISIDAGSVTLDLAGHSLTGLMGTTIASGATLKVAGAAAANIIGDVANAGILAPGASPGALHVDGDFNQSSTGRLQIEIASLSSFNRLQASGMSLAGALEVSLLGDYAPSLGATFDVLDFTSMAGSLSTLVLPHLDRMSWDVSRLYTDGQLQVIAAVPEPVAAVLVVTALSALAAGRRTTPHYLVLKIDVRVLDASPNPWRRLRICRKNLRDFRARN